MRQMGILTLIGKNLRYRPLLPGLVIALAAVSIGLATAVLLLASGLQQGIARAAGPFPLVAGAKGSPYQLVLNTVFLQDVPIGNVPASLVDELQGNPLVEAAVPLGFGDNYRGIRIVGTTAELFSWKNGGQTEPWLRIAEGRAFTAPFEAVLGAAAAAENHLQLGDTFQSSHGVVHSQDAAAHAQPFTVVGILQPLAAPYDRSILVSMESLYAVHAHGAAEAAGEPDAAEHGVTAVLVRPRGYQAAMQLAVQFSRSPAAQLVFPSQSILRFFALLGNSEKLLRIIAAAVIGMAFLILGCSLYWSALARRREYAVLHAIGGSGQQLRRLIFGEGMLQGIAGILLGLLLGHGAFWLLASLVSGSTAIGLQAGFPAAEAVLFLLSLLVAGLASLLPAHYLLRGDIAALLRE